jgi:hypothetical protein
LFKQIIKYFNKKEKNIPKLEETSKKIEIEVTKLPNITKVEIKEDCTVVEYVETMKEIDEELISDMIPNSTLFDKGTNINKKVIYLFEQENKKYSCYSNENIIFINERIYEENNHIDEITIKVYLNEDNYIISRMKHDESRSTYYVKSHEKKNPDYEFFQLGKENARAIIEDVLNGLEELPIVKSILDIDLVKERLKKEPVKIKK